MIDPAKDVLIPLTSRRGGKASVAEITGKNPKTILRWKTKGVLESIKIGGTWYTTSEALNSMCVHQAKPPATRAAVVSRCKLAILNRRPKQGSR